jgi:TPR repeat protein
VPGADATRWLRVAAEASDATSMLNLGMALFHGLGAKPDFVEAYMWFTLAAQRGAIDGRTGLRPRMTKPQAAEAERRAADWNTMHTRQ